MAMLSKLFSAFRPDPADSEPLPEPDAELALGALLVRIAKSDNEYHVAEIGLIDRILGKLYDLKEIEAAKMRATCERLHAAAPDTDTFAALIRETTRIDDRVAVMQALWDVVKADGHENDSELAMIENTRIALGVSRGENETARDAARSQL